MNRFFNIPGDLSRQLAPWELQAEGKPATAALFRLAEAIRFRSDIAGGIIVVPIGYLSDLASIPRALWNIFAPDDPRICLGAWVHDLLYQFEGKVTLEDGTVTALTRDQCDHILAFEAMPDLGADGFHQSAVYSALKYFGDRWP
jgi:hypothetical protein